MSDEGFAPLRELSGTLRRLHLDSCSIMLPPFLSELTALVAFRVQDGSDIRDPEDDLAILEAALPRLTTLTLLELRDVFSGTPPVGLTALTRLRHLLLEPYDGPVTGPIPSGAYLATLERLSAPAALLVRSLQQLSAASQLTEVAATSSFSTQEDALTVLRWAPHHSSLRRLMMIFTPDVELANAGLKAQRRRPSLHVEFANKLTSFFAA